MSAEFSIPTVTKATFSLFSEAAVRSLHPPEGTWGGLRGPGLAVEEDEGYRPDGVGRGDPGQSSRPAPGDGTTLNTVGAAKPDAANARVAASATASTFSFATSAIAAPPKPPPVMRAPIAPADMAASTAVS